MIIFIVPFLVFSPIFNTGKIISPNNLLPQTIQSEHSFFPNIIIFLIVCLVFAFIGKKIKSPTPYLLGPILGTAVLSLSGIHGPALPSTILNLSQFMIGGYIGLLLKPEKLEHKTKIISLALMSGIVMVAGSLVLSIFLIHYNHITPSTSLLSLAPGGMDQMGIMAHEVNADLSMVTGYQIFRLFFIYFAVPPALRWFFNVNSKKAEKTA
jgi:membrane AbrB-like protein